MKRPLVCRILFGSLMLCATVHAGAQTTAAQGLDAAAAAAGSDAAPDPVQKPSDLIAPAVDGMSQAVSQVQLEHWRGGVREETDRNLRSIERNVSTTLPPLVAAADAAPASVAASLPLLENLNAMCSVLIRVSVVARADAPAAQADALAGSLAALQDARNTLEAQVLQLAQAQESQIVALKHSVAALTANAAPAPPAATPAPATKKRKKVKKAAQ